jgi:YVTN family beta-propeller protein
MTAAPTAGGDRLSFRILGALTASRNGTEIAIVGPRQKALLTYLLLHANRVVPIERLIDELFGDKPPQTAVNSVHAGMSKLRRQLAGGESSDVPIVTRPPGYLIEIAEDELDLRRFEKLVEQGRAELESGDAEAAASTLRRALDLWHGEPLADLSAYRFAREEAARLEELRLAAVAERIEAELALGRHAQVIRELEALVAAHPLRERLRAQLMLALYRAGRQADALQVYQDTRRALVSELGLEPGRPLQRLEQQILTQDPELDLPPRELPKGAVTARPPLSRWRLAAMAGIAAALVLFAGLVALLKGRDGGSSLAALASNSVGVINVENNRLLAEVPVGQTPKGIVIGDGAVWVVNSGDATLSQIDPERRVVLRTITLPGAPSDAAFAGSVWVLHNRGTSFVDPFAGSASVVEVNPSFLSVERTIAVPAGFGNDYGDPIMATPRAVWVAGPTGVTKIDAGTGSVHPRLLLNGVTDLVAYRGMIWAVRWSGTLDRLDPSGEFVADTVSLSSTSTPVAAAAGDDAIWVIVQPTRGPGPKFVKQGGEAALFRVDARNGELSGKIRLGGSPTAVAVGQGAVWVADAERQEVVRVDPASNRIVARIPLGALPTAIAVDDNAVWVAVT